MVLPAHRLARLLGRFSGQITETIVDSMGWNGGHFRVPLDNDLVFGVATYALTTSVYLDARRRGLDISAIRYEDLVARPVDMCRVILEFCRLPPSLAELAVKAFETDSQRGSVFSQADIGNVRDTPLTPDVKATLNALLSAHDGVPLIGDSDVLDGTLSCTQ